MGNVVKGTVLRRKRSPQPKAPYKKPALQEKYDFLLSKLQIQDVDLWECDAMIALPNRLFFHVTAQDEMTMDFAVESAMRAAQE